MISNKPRSFSRHRFSFCSVMIIENTASLQTEMKVLLEAFISSLRTIATVENWDRFSALWI